MSPKVVKTWLVPLATTLLFFFLLVYTIPYAGGYGWIKIPLGSLLWTMWSLPDWEHAFFVPFICLFLVYLQREKIFQAPIRGHSAGGMALILLGLFLYCIGLKAETQYFGFAAVQILIAGLVLWYWGPQVFKPVSFAWLFFLFAWPMPFLEGMVALPLRLVMSHVSFGLLNLLGTATLQSGTAILSAPDAVAGLKAGEKFQIDIADPCSGLHSLFALMMISALAAYVSVRRVPLRWLVFLASIPIAIAGNVVRILLLVWGTEHFGAAFALGTEENPSAYHMGCGYAVYAVALLLLFAIIGLCNSAWMERRLAFLASARPAAAPVIS